jgi:hypothetical protein
MDKIWIVYNKGSYKKKYRIFKTEADMAKNISDSDRYTILEYELKSSTVASDYMKSKERDTQLRTILGELSEHETNGLKLIELYDALVPVNPNDRYNRKQNQINHLKKIVSDKKAFANYLVNNKKQFFQVSDSLEWVLSILKCHNFQDYIYDSARWDSVKRTYVKVDNASDALKENFKLAKAELKKIKKK